MNTMSTGLKPEWEGDDRRERTRRHDAYWKAKFEEKRNEYMNRKQGSESENEGEGQREREDKEARRREQGYLDAFKKNIQRSLQEETNRESPYIVELSRNQKADEKALSNAIQNVMNRISRSAEQRERVTKELQDRSLI